MAQFTHANAADYGRRGGQRSHQHLETQYADLVLRNPSAAQRVARLIQQGYRLVVALRSVAIVDRAAKGGR
jgi:plasmid stabilization system protein ParE